MYYVKDLNMFVNKKDKVEATGNAKIFTLPCEALISYISSALCWYIIVCVSSETKC